MHEEFIKPGFDQSKARLVEEIGEVLQALGKCERFGWHNRYPEGDATNFSKLNGELNDLADAIDRFKIEYRKVHLNVV